MLKKKQVMYYKYQHTSSEYSWILESPYDQITMISMISTHQTSPWAMDKSIIQVQQLRTDQAQKTMLGRHRDVVSFVGDRYLPRCSMYGIVTNIWVIHGVNVRKYAIHGAYGLLGLY